MTAGIALYPETVITQILYAAENPGDVTAAAEWVRTHPEATDAEIEKQPWHPAVKALVKSPSILQMMNQRMAWTQTLGGAFMAQQKDVLASLTRMRRQAEAVAGNPTAVPQLDGAPLAQVQQAAPQQVQIVPVVVPVSGPSYTYNNYYTNNGYTNGYGYGYGYGGGIVVGGATVIVEGNCGGGRYYQSGFGSGILTSTVGGVYVAGTGVGRPFPVPGIGNSAMVMGNSGMGLGNSSVGVGNPGVGVGRSFQGGQRWAGQNPGVGRK